MYVGQLVRTLTQHYVQNLYDSDSGNFWTRKFVHLNSTECLFEMTLPPFQFQIGFNVQGTQLVSKLDENCMSR